MKKIITILLPLGIFCTMPTPARGDTFDEIVNRTVSNSPAIRASRARMASELEGMKADNMPPDPEVEFERLWRAGEGENRWSAGISQEIGWPGVYSARRKAIKSLEEAQKSLMAGDIVSERLKASQLLVEIIAANKETGVLTEINEAMQLLQAKYLRAWAHGETTILDVNKIKIEAVRSATALESAQSRLRSLKAELTAMSGNESAIEIPAGLDFPHESLGEMTQYLSALETTPELENLRKTAELARNSSAIANASRFPGLSLGYSHAYEDGAHFNGFSIGLSLPVWSRSHSTKSAHATELAARFDLAARTAALGTQLQADYANAMSLHEQMSSLGPVVDGVNNLTLLRKALDGGELNLLSYIQEVNYFLQARLDYIAASKEFTLLALKLNSVLESSCDSSL